MASQSYPDHKRSSVLFACCTLVLSLILSATLALASDREGELYAPSDDVSADVAMARRAAVNDGKLLLIVMGANWCHDSRALASRLYQDPLKGLIDENYETVFVDVGFLDIGPDVVSSLGVPVYYATPTVLIQDPASGRLVNADNRHQWGNAYNISMEESVAYFQLMADENARELPAKDAVSSELERLMEDIDDFQQVQAQRLYEAYGVIGPMLRAYKEGTEPAGFDERWNEVRDFRMKIPPDIAALQSEAEMRTSAAEQDIRLQYPVYEAFSWEPIR